ncbi:hypothetical protein RND71_036830 [Anisodus tanguticus]|uniref:FAR1 domain-containing protein n=1 Tax=Anisodus tanguticus TaxID=243964 RepID=A0AAE1UY93_9SOLA|nr:hypothetical protein RND71_036830 [Anisodus tanguticus]
MVDDGDVVQSSVQLTGDMVDAVDNRDGGVACSPKRSITRFEENAADFEPHDGIEFESHEAAYAFYQEYAKSMGFTTSIKNSRRSKKSKEFIDAKFACSRYGVTPESDTGSSRRPSIKKTDCKASMHVKRKRDGKWYIHEFIKEHNHELLPALAYHFRIHRNVKVAEKNNIDILHAVSERTRKMYVEMSRQCGGSQEVGVLTNDLHYQFDKGRVQRYNDLCRRAIELSEEGSLSAESYAIAFRVLDEALKNCVNVNNTSCALTECSSSAVGLRDLEEDTQGIHATKTSRKKNANKKQKVHTEPEAAIVQAQDSLQQMDNLGVGGMTLNGYYGTQQNVQGLIQLNLMEPPHDGYYVNQQNMQGLGQLNTIAPGHDGFLGSQQSIPGLGHLDFRQPSFTYGLQDEPSLRAAQLHGNNARG